MIPQPSPWPRALATGLMGFILLVLSTTLLAWWDVGGVRLQPVIVVAVSAGFYLPLTLGTVVVFLLGVLADLLSGGFVGLCLSAMMVAFLISVGLATWLDIDTWPFQMIAVGLLSLVGQLIVLGGLVLAERSFVAPANQWLIIVTQSFLCALTAPLFFLLLEKLVALLSRLWPSRESLGGA